MADFVTNTSETLQGDIFLEIGTGGSNTLIDSYVDSSNKFILDFELKNFDKTVKTNLTMTFTHLDEWTALTSTIKDELFTVSVNGSPFFKGLLDKPSLSEDHKNKRIKFTIVQSDYVNQTYSSAPATVSFTDYLADIVSNTTGSTITYIDSVSWDLDNGDTVFLNTADVSGDDSNILLNGSEANTRPFISILRRILQFDLIEWKGELFVVPYVRNTTTTTSLVAGNILGLIKNQLWTTEDFANQYRMSMLPRTEGLLDGSIQYKIDYDSSTSKRIIGSQDLITAYDNHLYSYNSSGSRSPNWTESSAFPNSVTFFYTVTQGSQTENLVRLRSIDRNEFYIELDETYMDSGFTANGDVILHYNFRITLINELSSADTINDQLYIQIVGSDKKFITDLNFESQLVVFDANTYTSEASGDLRIGYIPNVTTFTISFALWAIGIFLIRLDKDYGTAIYSIGDTMWVEDVTNYTGTFVITDILINAGLTQINFTTANNGVAALGSNPLVYREHDIQIGVSDISVSYREASQTVNEIKLDTDLDITDQIELTSTDASVMNSELVDLFIIKAIENMEVLNGIEKKRYNVTYKGEINPYQAVSFDSTFFKIVKYKYDLISDTTSMEMIEQ